MRPVQTKTVISVDEASKVNAGQFTNTKYESIPKIIDQMVHFVEWADDFTMLMIQSLDVYPVMENCLVK